MVQSSEKRWMCNDDERNIYEDKSVENCKFYFSKTNDIKQEFGIEKDKYEKYEASVDLTADE